MPAKESAKTGRDLTKGPIRKTLLLMSLPVMFGFAIQTAYTLIDTYFVGILGTDQLAAISLTYPVVFIFIAIAGGLSVGTTALISHAIGAGNKKDAANTAIHSIILGAIVGIAIALTGLVYSPFLYQFMGASGAVLSMAITFSNIIFFGFILMFIGNMAQGVIQAGGDVRTPARNLIISAIVNIILDPIFIFGIGPVPAMGIAGAAIATFIAIGIATALNLYHIFSGKSRVCIEDCKFRYSPSIFRRIMMVGIPSSLSNSLNSIGMIFIMSFVGVFGTVALAAYGVGLRLESLALLPQVGIMTALIPIVGQNLGAGKVERAREAVRFACYFSMALMAFFITIWFFLPQFLFSPFTTDPEIISIGSEYFRIIIFGYIFLGLNLMIASAFIGAGRTGLSMTINLLRWIFIIASSILMIPMLGLKGIWLAFPIGNICGFALAYTLYKKDLWLKGWKEGKSKKMPENVPETV